MDGETTTDRTVLRLTGADRVHFLQGLVSNDVSDLTGRLVYAAMLTPQGKYLADFFLTADGDTILMDVKTDLAEALVQRLTMYKLRADVQIEATDLHVIRGRGTAPEGTLPDPRMPDLGWRAYEPTPAGPETTDWTALRVAHCIPETGIELIPDHTYILEAGFERLNGVDFHKGCYVGQEVTARMKHKTELKKGLVTVTVQGAAPVGTVITAQGKPVGTLYTQSGGQGLAYLRHDRASGPMQAADATLAWDHG